MPASSTVENYLKAIYKAQMALDDERALVPMGHLASDLNVVPGTATTMVKALADSGLVKYEPYAGVRLTSAGAKLAALVLRRHRLIELFLVQVMGMSWAEVHDEAEQLEHAVSDRLIERIDELLGHPSVDPHGDPIPDPEGTLEPHKYLTLLTCPLHTSVIVARVADQDAEFLRFVEVSDLKPGQAIEVEAREAAADSVRVRGKDDRRITIGMRAASKLLVEVAGAILLALCLALPVGAQTPAPAPSEPFAILDNSFLVEEAFNQESGIFQNIFGFVRVPGEGWEFAFTQEWPVGTQRHQLSYTLPFVGHTGRAGVGDVLLNYRYQLLTAGPGRPAFAPRLSVVLPSGDERQGRGAGTVGWQVNLPFSKQVRDVYVHWNVGFTHHQGLDSPCDSAVHCVGGVFEANITTPHVGASAIYRWRPMLHLMVEGVAEFEEAFEEGIGALTSDGSRTSRSASVTLSPGLRGGWNVGDQQIITGVAIPITFADDTREAGVLLYFSYELPFRR